MSNPFSKLRIRNIIYDVKDAVARANIGNLSDLITASKDTLVDAINEAARSGGTAGITWVSNNATSSEIEAAYQSGNIVAVKSSGMVYYLTNRGGPTLHRFTSKYSNTLYGLTCTNDVWYNENRYVPIASAVTPRPLGTGSIGSSADFARGDHVHPMPSASDVGAAQDEALDGKNPVVLTLIHGSIDANGVITTGGNRWISANYIAGNVVYEVTNNTAGNVFIDYYNYDDSTDTYVFGYAQTIPKNKTSVTDNTYSHIRVYAYNTGATSDMIIINEIIRVERLNKVLLQKSKDIPFYLLAHRGASTLAPQNTLPAFALAAKRGYNVIETDLRWTSDGVPVLLHSSDINSTAKNADGTDISGTVYIADITYSQALEYDFGIAFGPEYAGTKIPTLEQGLALCKHLGVMMSLEMKVHSGVSVAMRTDILSKIKTAGMQGKVFLTSFRMNDLRILINSYEWEYGLCGLWINTSATDLNTQQEDNDITMGEAIRYLSAWQTDIAPCGIHWTANRLTDAIAEAVTDSGISLGAYVLDSASDIIALNKAVTAVTTNSVTFEDIANAYI